MQDRLTKTNRKLHLPGATVVDFTFERKEKDVYEMQLFIISSWNYS